LELNFNLLRNEQKKIVGFSLAAGSETYSELFCESLGKLIHDRGTAAIKMDPEMITFLVPAKPYSVKLSKEQAEELSQLFANPKKLGLYREPYSLSLVDFRVVLIEEKDKKLEKVELSTVFSRA